VVLNSYVLKEKSLFMMLANIGWSILLVAVFLYGESRIWI